MKRTVLVFLVLVALGAPAATAAGPGSLSPVQRIVRQENRGGRLSVSQPVAASPVQRILVQEDARRNDPELLGAGPATTVEITESGGFHWGDAGIGAAVVFAVMLVLAGTALVLRAGRPRRA